MVHHRKRAVHYFIRTGLLAFFAYYILRLVKNGLLVLYIAPRLEIYVKAAAIGFYVLAVLQLILAFRNWWGQPGDEACACPDCGTVPVSRLSNGIFYGLFALPVLLALLLPDAAMSSNMVAKKGIRLTGQVSAQAAAPVAASPSPSADPAARQSPITDKPGGTALDELFPYDEYSKDLAKLAKKLYAKDSITIGESGFIETISALDFYMNPFIGKKAEISGFVYREDDMAENQFVVARFALQCCSADAFPFGLLIESSMGRELPKDTWVRITGTLGSGAYNGNELLKIDASKIERIPAPASPYIYPEYDYYEKFQ